MALPNPLRSITVRLNASPVEDLPRYAGFLALSISNCAEIIRTAEGQKGETSLLLHKLKTRISSLLQDKTSEGRFTGIVLVKAIIDAGGPQTLTTSGAWARNLLSCLNKQDPPEVKKLCLVAITRIFLLTKDYPSLMREITTPALPSFITTSLSLIKPLAVVKGNPDKNVLNPLVQPVLQCWLQLIHHFPPTFRPLLPQIRTIILGLTGDETTSKSTRSLAADVLAALHFSAPKNTAPLDWAQTCQHIIEATHQTADKVFRSILEEWTSINSRSSEPINGKVSSNVESKESDALGMASWNGMHAGCSRIVYLLGLLTATLTTKQAQPVGIPLAEILDLTARMAAVIPPTAQFSLRQNQEISRDEREELWIQLPRMHKASIDLLNGISHAYQRVLKPVMPVLSSQILDMFEATNANSDVKEAAYRAFSTLFEDCNLKLTAADSGNLAILIGLCCSDLRSGTMESASQSQSTLQDKSTNSTNLALSTQNGSSTATTQVYAQQSTTYRAAWDLLPHLFVHVTPLLTASVRADLDRTAILLGHEKAMLASVLNPPIVRKGVRIAPSILPFLARADTGNLAFEALVRPRMPVIMDPSVSKDILIEEEETQEDETPLYEEDVQMQQEDVNESTRQTTTEIDATKKRDFASIESSLSSTADPAPEVTKRSRIGDQFRIPEEVSNASDIRSKLHTVDQEADIQQEYESKEVVAASTEPSAISTTSIPAKSVSQPGPLSTTNKVVQGGEDDSDDDDEIPTIDATLTSDSEGEDEDEEMEES